MVPGSGVPPKGALQVAGAEVQKPCGHTDQAANACLLGIFKHIHG